MSISNYDVIVLGGGAAGLMCALTAGQRGRRVLVLEVSNKLGKKILMSGGGRCNFTNLEVQAHHFISSNPHFVKSALAQYTNWDFIGLVAKHNVAYHEKEQGQLFCDESAKDILALLKQECDQANVSFQLNCETHQVDHNLAKHNLDYTKSDCARFTIGTSKGAFSCASLVVATGGLSIPTLGGATGLGYSLAKQFGLKVIQTRASLVPFTLSGKWQDFSSALSGVSVHVQASVPTKSFRQGMLFTHRGLSGPAVLQLSNYWQLGETIYIDLLPTIDVQDMLVNAKAKTPNMTPSQVFSGKLPSSLLKHLQLLWWQDKPLQSFRHAELESLAKQFQEWQLKPSGTEGYRTAEVTQGGVDVSQISSKTMQVDGHEGLFFIGEVLDVTGHLGGFNFQWAWSSAYVAGQNA